MSDKRLSQGTVARKCFEYWKVAVDGFFQLPCKCDDCKGALFNPANTAWQADHRIPRAHGGSDLPPNVRPLKLKCHQKKTATQDIPSIAEGKRQAASVFGFKQSRQIMPGSRRSRWKKKMNGEVVER